MADVADAVGEEQTVSTGRGTRGARAARTSTSRAVVALLGAAALSAGLALPAAATSTGAEADDAAVSATATTEATDATGTDDGATDEAGTDEAGADADATDDDAPADGPEGSSPAGDGTVDGAEDSAAAPDPAAVAAYEAAVAASSEASARLAEVSARAGAALEARDAARARADAASAEVVRQRQVAASAATTVAAERSAVGRWASSAYRGGEDARSLPVASALLGSATTDEVGAQLSMLEAVGRTRSVAVTGALDADEVARRALARADAAQAEADSARATADAEAAAAEEALDEQRALVAEVDARLAQARTDLGVAVEEAKKREAEAAALAAASATVLSGPVDLTGLVGGCASDDLSAYPNGQIPLTALCELQTAPGHHLRGDAAKAFDVMSRSYEQTFGTPICVTDSYRPLETQISLRASKPGLAAKPGTSRHGLGRAVDLCGGVNRFGTAQHEWMAQRAPLFGWFHPSWAQQGGSKPEPWHFEFAETSGS